MLATAIPMTLALVAGLYSADAPPEWPWKLQARVVQVTRRFDGELHLYVRDLSTGVEYGHNALTPTYIASGVKIFFMIEAFAQLEAGSVSPDDYLEYDKVSVRDGAPLLNYVPIGAKLPLRVVLEAMIQQSDNAASDMVVRHVGLDNINVRIPSLGIHGIGPVTTLIEVRRLVYERLDPRARHLKPRQLLSLGLKRSPDARIRRLNELLKPSKRKHTSNDLYRAFDRYYETGLNSATMMAMGEVLARLATGRIVNPAASAAMIDILAGTQTGGNRIPKSLPPSLRIAHKTGTQFRRTCDLAVIYPPEHPGIVFCACAKDSRRAKREEVIARLARASYDAILNRPSPPLPPDRGLPKSESRTLRP